MCMCVKWTETESYNIYVHEGTCVDSSFFGFLFWSQFVDTRQIWCWVSCHLCHWFQKCVGGKLVLAVVVKVVVVVITCSEIITAQWVQFLQAVQEEGAATKWWASHLTTEAEQGLLSQQLFWKWWSCWEVSGGYSFLSFSLTAVRKKTSSYLCPLHIYTHTHYKTKSCMV